MLQLTLDPILDQPRLNGLLGRVLDAMISGEWMTLAELKAKCGNSEAGISARIRELRRLFGYTINRRRRGAPKDGCWEYRLEGKQ